MSTRAVIIGVMGGGETASKKDREAGFALGAFIAHRGWITLSGGRDTGVMAAVNRGARSKSGLTLGIDPGRDRGQVPQDVLIPVLTAMGSARNNINVLTSDVVVAVAFRIGAGTTSEVALALKAGKPVVLLTDDVHSTRFLSRLGGDLIQIVTTVAEVEAALVNWVSANIPVDRRYFIQVPQAGSS